jgi:hypothetical protein
MVIIIIFLNISSGLFIKLISEGDITPDTWPSKLFMGVMIIVALVVIPTQVIS